MTSSAFVFETVLVEGEWGKMEQRGRIGGWIFVHVLKGRERNKFVYLVLTVLSSPWKVSKNDPFTVYSHVQI